MKEMVAVSSGRKTVAFGVKMCRILKSLTATRMTVESNVKNEVDAPTLPGMGMESASLKRLLLRKALISLLITLVEH